ncbi:MAG: hypothetical protein U0132_09350 [Gemmatimonadaceae bacterium]
MSDLGELRRQFAALGLAMRVEAHERQLVLIPEGVPPDLTDQTLRARVVAIAQAASFTHVALELVDEHATVHRDQPDG